MKKHLQLFVGLLVVMTLCFFATTTIQAADAPIQGVIDRSATGGVDPAVSGNTGVIHYVPLSGLTMPNGQEIPVNNVNFTDYLKTMYKIGIGAVFTIAFLSFLYAGWEYVGSDTITKKEDGKKRLTDTAIGVIIALSGFALLNTINPDILSFRGVNLDVGAPADTNKNWLSLFFSDGPTTVGTGSDYFTVLGAHTEAGSPEVVIDERGLSRGTVIPGTTPLGGYDTTVSLPEGTVVRKTAIDYVNGVAVTDPNQLNSLLHSCSDPHNGSGGSLSSDGVCTAKLDVVKYVTFPATTDTFGGVIPAKRATIHQTVQIKYKVYQYDPSKTTQTQVQ